MVIHEETKSAEEKEQAEYRSPTWYILRALQKINKAKRLEGEAVMSDPLFFQSAGRRDLTFWGEDDGPTDVAWERLSDRSRSSGRKRWASRRIGWFGVGRGKKTKSNTHLKSMEKKSFKPQQANKSQSRRKDGSKRRQRAVSALESMVATEQHQMCSEPKVCFVSLLLGVHQDCHVADEQ